MQARAADAPATAAAAALAACAAEVTPQDRGLAIGAIFVIAAASFIGFLAPAFLQRHSGRFTQIAIVAASATGTGVLLGVSLVHILADAEQSLSSPCLPKAWLDAFPNWGTLICAATIMAMVILDYVLQGIFERKFKDQEEILEAATTAASLPLHAAHSLHRHASLAALDLPMHGAAGRALSLELPEAHHAAAGAARGQRQQHACPSPFSAAAAGGKDAAGAAGGAAAAAAPGRQKQLLPVSDQDTKGGEKDDSSGAGGARAGEGGAAAAHQAIDFGHSHGGEGEGGGLTEEAALALKRGAVIFVEASVCTHSIPVGLALGMQGADAFVSLFIAVVVHQMLEGLGVGAAALEARYGGRPLLALACGFSATAPAGVALGVGLRAILNQSDPRYLMALGIVNAVASGMLLYVAIEHMNAIGSKGAWLRRQHWAAQLAVVACFCAGGAALMLIGKYA